MTERTITVKPTTPYGRHEPLYKPLCANAQAFAALLRQTTLTEPQIAIITSRLGYTVLEDEPKLTLQERIARTAVRMQPRVMPEKEGA